MINVIIIDDEPIFISSLEFYLNKYFPNVNIMGKATNVNDAVALLKMTTPNLAFFDINLPDGNAFDVLDQIGTRNFEIIFTTAHSDYALRAFECSALHYLMKPVELEKLQEAMERYSKATGAELSEEKISVLKDHILKTSQRLLLKSTEGIGVYNIADIVRCEADVNYTNVYLKDGLKIVVSKTLHNFDKLLRDFDFIRIHNKHLVNLRYIKKYYLGKKLSLILSDDTELPISQTQKNEFSERMEHYANTI